MGVEWVSEVKNTHVKLQKSLKSHPTRGSFQHPLCSDPRVGLSLARITDLHKIWLSTSIDPENGYFKIVISGNKQSKGGGFSCKKTVNRQVVTKIAGSEIDCESKLFDISLNHIFSKYSSVNICLDLGGAVDTLNSSKLERVEINEKDANKVELTNFSFSGDIQMQFSCKLPEQDDRDVRTTPLVEYKMFINLCFQLSKYQNSLP